jgi:RNA polymerase-binding transcription factor DksA
MSRHLLGVLEPAIVLQINRDAGCPPGVTSDRGEKTSRLGPLPNRGPGVVAVKSSSGHCRSRRINALEQGLPALEACGDNVLVQYLLEQVMHWHLVLFAALFVGVSRDTLRSRAEGSEASAFGMHQADAGSDAYDRGFALSLLSQEQDALYEIEEALKRVDAGTYGICEMSGKPIPHARLEAIPFARFTVECQTQIEKQKKAMRLRQPVKSLFGLTDEEGGEGEEDTITDSKD